MHFVVKRTWLAGADPAAGPDTVRTAAVCLSFASAETRAESLARTGREARRDPHTGSWWMRTADALHELVVSDAPAGKG